MTVEGVMIENRLRFSIVTPSPMLSLISYPYLQSIESTKLNGH
jgi:hypothetical protein